VGLSVTVTVDVKDTSGPLMSSQTEAIDTRADLGEDANAAADRIIARILAENGATRMAGASRSK
jgi:membrane fusion protein, multidrug efflux system